MTQDSPSSEMSGFAAPTVDAQRCVHGLSPIAECRACVAACPVSAFELGDDGLTLDVAVCDGCGLCAAACPEQAIEVAGAAVPLVAPPVDPDRAYMACSKVARCSEPGRVTCLHAVTPGHLANLHYRNIRALVIAHGDCSDCAYGRVRPLADHVAEINRIAVDRNQPPFAVHRRSIEDWREERDQAGRVSRRTLFRAAFVRHMRGVEQSKIAALNASHERSRIGTAAIVVGSGRARIAPTTPTIDPAACVACGACLEVCPHKVFRLTGTARGEPRYLTDATQCTGCGLCVAACEPDAIALSRWGPARPPAVELVSGQCTICASPFYAVKGTTDDVSVCRICATKPHRQKLFQVLP